MNEPRYEIGFQVVVTAWLAGRELHADSSAAEPFPDSLEHSLQRVAVELVREIDLGCAPIRAGRRR